jgi:hypothetical protein
MRSKAHLFFVYFFEQVLALSHADTGPTKDGATVA